MVDQQSQTTLNTLLILIVALLQFVLRQGKQTDSVKELEQRLEQLEEQLETIQQRLWRP
jgi:hypothetical protein